LPKLNAPGDKFHYSCLGFIMLANIIKEITEANVHQFSQEFVYKPLNLKKTGYIPQIDERIPDPNSYLYKKYKDKIVPTEVIQNAPYLGTVHDPLARLQKGISGNAGLFSCVDDMFKFAQMLLNGGEYDGKRIFSPLTIQKMSSIYFRTKASGRGLGWDLTSSYSTIGGDLFPEGGFGHSGFTGTSIWIHPSTETIVIFLTNRVHPIDDGSIVRLRSLVANVVAAAIIEE
jgi:CubicO group peptidase (beta-lactamase class C family)